MDLTWVKTIEILMVVKLLLHQLHKKEIISFYIHVHENIGNIMTFHNTKGKVLVFTIP
jgi:hypothetical protein